MSATVFTGGYVVSEREMMDMRGILQMEIDEAARQLAYLREAARRYSDFFARIADDLRQQPEDLTAEKMQKLTPGERKSLEMMSVVEVTDGIRRKTAELEDLRTRLATLR